MLLSSYFCSEYFQGVPHLKCSNESCPFSTFLGFQRGDSRKKTERKPSTVRGLFRPDSTDSNTMIRPTAIPHHSLGPSYEMKSITAPFPPSTNAIPSPSSCRTTTTMMMMALILNASTGECSFRALVGAYNQRKQSSSSNDSMTTAITTTTAKPPVCEAVD